MAMLFIMALISKKPLTALKMLAKYRYKKQKNKKTKNRIFDQLFHTLFNQLLRKKACHFNASPLHKIDRK